METNIDAHSRYWKTETKDKPATKPVKSHLGLKSQNFLVVDQLITEVKTHSHMMHQI